MNSTYLRSAAARTLISIVFLICALGIGVQVSAFPPAPHHLYYGLVRDEYGTPIQSTNAQIVFESPAGTLIKSPLAPGLAPGLNYRLRAPMDAGVTASAYKPGALRQSVPFRIKVVIGRTVYVPMEMVVSESRLGEPGGRTLLNLTLGEDSDGDGIPDSWERAAIGMSGGGAIGDFRPGDDADRDGLSNYDEYLAGTYAFDQENSVRLDPAGMRDSAPILEFTAILGRSYAIVGSSDLVNWTAIDFRIPGVEQPQSLYQATDVRLLRIEVVSPVGTDAPKFYRLMLR
jgi:hypothetical protein